MADVQPAAGVRFDAEAQVAIIGGGACGLVAALKARAAGAEVVVLERDDSPAGSTAMSSGFIPAPGTRFQHALGIDDSPALFEADIQAKARGRAEPVPARAAARTIGPVLEWLADAHGLDWIVLDDFLYPGHSRQRMHAVPEKTGAALLARLLAAAGAAGADLATGAHVTTLYAETDGRIAGIAIERPDGGAERLGCRALVLACNGYGANPELVAGHIPEMARAPYFGHQGNTGDALLWGQALGAATGCLGACQGHGSLAHPHGVLITWALMMEGGIQVNTGGLRFSNEHDGYSEQSVAVLAQPGAVAWCLFDERLRDFARGFPDFREAEAAGAILSGSDAGELAAVTHLPPRAVGETLARAADLQAGRGADPFGRDFTAKPALAPPYFAVRVTGALFHTQGGLMIDQTAAVRRAAGDTFPNLFAGGGAACGVSGPDLAGYLSGNGLLTAVAFGALAGAGAARRAQTKARG